MEELVQKDPILPAPFLHDSTFMSEEKVGATKSAYKSKVQSLPLAKEVIEVP